MDIMAGRTAECRMFALVLTQLLDLAGVACQAGICNIGCKRYVERRVRVPVTTQTPLCLEMRFPLVALIALRNVVLRSGTMAAVAILAGDRLMTRPVCVYLGRLVRMAFDAVT